MSLEIAPMGETYAYHFVLSRNQSNFRLSDEEKDILDIVIEKLGKMSKNEIINFMHRESQISQITLHTVL